MVDEQVAYLLGSDGKKVRRVVQVQRFRCDQPHLQFVNQSRRKDRLARALVPHMVCAEPAQLLVRGYGEILASLLIVCAPRAQQRRERRCLCRFSNSTSISAGSRQDELARRQVVRTRSSDQIARDRRAARCARVNAGVTSARVDAETEGAP
jgi:hypothetical protein